MIGAACARTPASTIVSGEGISPDDCATGFPPGRWQVTHSLVVTAPFGNTAQLIGVSVVDAKARRFDCALMTIEGLILFSGRYDGHAVVDRALPPMDRRGFAEGLMSDLKLIFFPPSAPLLGAVRTTDGNRICRYGRPGGPRTDLKLTTDGWELLSYGEGSRLERTLRAVYQPMPPPPGGRFADHVILEAHGAGGYTIDLVLLEAVPLPPEALRQ
jgi:hypothetical protein